MTNVVVAASSIPEWIDLAEKEQILNQVESGQTTLASFDFSVIRNAPVGKSVSLKFEILSENTLIQEKEFIPGG